MKTTDLWMPRRGATVLPDGAVRFSVWAPNAENVRVRVIGGAAAGEHALERSSSELGVHELVVPGVGAGVDYGYLLDGESETLLPDPRSRWQAQGVHGASRIHDPRAFVWTDEEWRGVAMAELVIYELHVGTFTREGTFDAIVPQLRSLRCELGVTAIELMPVAQFPGTRNWGYDGVAPFAVQDSYGGPDGLKRLVNAAHAEGLAVILDVVYNHLGPEGNNLGRFGPYFTEKYRTPWGAALNYDDAQSDEVRRLVVDNARYWVNEYHMDGLRLDAVHGIFDFSARHLLAEIADAVHADGDRLERDVVVIGESDLNDPKLLRSPAEHGYGLDGQWSDDFHHAVHAALTGETSGYYADFGGAELIARALREPFVYDGGYSKHRQRRHGAPSRGIPREKFVVAIQNHDQVGNRAAGDRLATLLTPPQLRLAAALLLLSPYVPLLFMGEEYGETNPFQYFVSHGVEELVEAVRKGRRNEFAAFGWADDVPDPQGETTFQRSVVEREKRARSPHAELFALYRDLIAVRDEDPMMRPDGADVAVEYARGGIALLRTARAGTPPTRGPATLALFNCTAAAVDVALPATAAGRWTLRLSTEAAGYGGAGDAAKVPHEIDDAEETHATSSVGAASASAAPWRAAEPRRLLDRRQPSAERTVTLPAWSAALYQRN